MSRFQSESVGAYPEYAQASAGGPTFPVFAAINEPAGQTMPNQRLQFGDRITDKFGNTYLYVRAATALAIGQVVRHAIAGDGDVPANGAVSASTTVNRIFSTITTTLDERALGSFLASPGTVSSSAGIEFIKQIKKQVAIGANTTFDVSLKQIFFGSGQYDGDTLASIPVTADKLYVIRPYNVCVHGAASATTKENGPVGVALGTVTAAGGTLIQTGGICAVLGLGSGTALVENGPASAAASGQVIGGSAVVDAVVGRSLMATATSTARLIAVRLYLDGRM